MLTTINLNAVKRYVEDAFSTSLATDQTAFIPLAFNFKNSTDLQQYVNTTNQICVGNLAYTYTPSNAVNSFQASLLNLNTTAVWNFYTSNLAGQYQNNINFIAFTDISIGASNNIDPNFYFFGWVITTNL